MPGGRAAWCGADVRTVSGHDMPRRPDGKTPWRNDMADWLPIAAVSECPPGTSLERVVGERIVALANVDGGWHAIDGLCPHQGGPLGTGTLCGATLTCPWHGWQFDLPSGRHRISATVVQPRFDVREEEGRVLIRVEGGSPVELAPAPRTPSGGTTA